MICPNQWLCILRSQPQGRRRRPRRQQQQHPGRVPEWLPRRLRCGRRLMPPEKQHPRPSTPSPPQLRPPCLPVCKGNGDESERWRRCPGWVRLHRWRRRRPVRAVALRSLPTGRWTCDTGREDDHMWNEATPPAGDSSVSVVGPCSNRWPATTVNQYVCQAMHNRMRLHSHHCSAPGGDYVRSYRLS
jgi:hypothetical protein